MRVFADALAVADSEQQGAFLNSFAQTLRASCRGAGNSSEMQAYYIAKELHATTVEVLKEIVDNYEWGEEERRKNINELETKRSMLRSDVEHLQRRKKELEEEINP